MQRLGGWVAGLTDGDDGEGGRGGGGPLKASIIPASLISLYQSGSAQA